MTEHLLEGRANPGEVRWQAMNPTEWKGWSQDPPSPRSYINVGSGGKGVSLEVPGFLSPSEGKQLCSFVFVSLAVAFGLILSCCSLRLSYPTVFTVFSITL